MMENPKVLRPATEKELVGRLARDFELICKGELKEGLDRDRYLAYLGAIVTRATRLVADGDYEAPGRLLNLVHSSGLPIKIAIRKNRKLREESVRPIALRIESGLIETLKFMRSGAETHEAVEKMKSEEPPVRKLALHVLANTGRYLDSTAVFTAIKFGFDPDDEIDEQQVSHALAALHHDSLTLRLGDSPDGMGDQRYAYTLSPGGQDAHERLSRD
jgi:hypothetical protein